MMIRNNVFINAMIEMTMIVSCKLENPVKSFILMIRISTIMRIIGAARTTVI